MALNTMVFCPLAVMGLVASRCGTINMHTQCISGKNMLKDFSVVLTGTMRLTKTCSDDLKGAKILQYHH